MAGPRLPHVRLKRKVRLTSRLRRETRETRAPVGKAHHRRRALQSFVLGNERPYGAFDETTARRLAGTKRWLIKTNDMEGSYEPLMTKRTGSLLIAAGLVLIGTE